MIYEGAMGRYGLIMAGRHFSTLPDSRVTPSTTSSVHLCASSLRTRTSSNVAWRSTTRMVAGSENT